MKTSKPNANPARFSGGVLALNPNLSGPVSVNSTQTEKPERPSNPRKGHQPNKTESAFFQLLEARRRRGEFQSVTFEGAKLRLGENCFYAPDFMAVDNTGLVTFFETKGAHTWEDSIIKFKAAKEIHSWAMFELWQRKAGEWRQLY
jgi:hypothetical protein